MPRRSSGRSAGRLSRAALAAVVLLVAAAPAARAQATIDAPAVDSAAPTPHPASLPAPAAVGPTLDGARAGAARATSAAPLTVADPVTGPRAGRPVALMIVGGAALILGAIIGGSGGTAVAIGGAVVGLVGLYQFIR